MLSILTYQGAKCGKVDCLYALCAICDAAISTGHTVGGIIVPRHTLEHRVLIFGAISSKPCGTCAVYACNIATCAPQPSLRGYLFVTNCIVRHNYLFVVTFSSKTVLCATTISSWLPFCHKLYCIRSASSKIREGSTWYLAYASSQQDRTQPVR